MANDGLCAISEAITSANTDTASGAAPGECPAGSRADTIELGLAVTYTLSMVDNEPDGTDRLPYITSEISIDGNNSTIDRDVAALNFRLFHVASVGYLTLNDVTVSRGIASDRTRFGTDSGAVFTRSRFTMIASTLSSDSSIGSEGGMFVQTGTTTVIDSVIESNTASLRGGDISINAGRMSIVSSTISNNTATGNGGGPHHGTDFLTRIIRSNFADNTARRGGGLYARGTVETANSSFRNNTARGDGGGLYSVSGVHSISAITINGNTQWQHWRR